MQARVERLELLVEQLQGEIRAFRAIVGVGSEDFEVVSSSSAPVRSGARTSSPTVFTPERPARNNWASLQASGPAAEQSSSSAAPPGQRVQGDWFVGHPCSCWRSSRCERQRPHPPGLKVLGVQGL